MIIVCDELDWIVDAVSAEIVDRTVTSGKTVQERMANLAAWPVLRIRDRGGHTWDWPIPEGTDRTRLLHGIGVYAATGYHLPKSANVRPVDDDS